MSRSVYDILKLNPNNYEDYQVINREYIPHDIEQIRIDGRLYKNYGGYWFFWEKTYLKEPKRSNDGSMPNINGIVTFLTGHLVIDFSIISIDDYRAIMRSHYEQNEHVVQCYDPIYNEDISIKMYFATEERKKLYTINRSRFNNGEWEDFLMLAGVHEYQLEMIGTNNDFYANTVQYNLNAPSDVGDYMTVIGSTSVPIGMEFICGSNLERDVVNETFNGAYRFVGWNTKKDGSGQPYLDGYSYTLVSQWGIVLYAMWEKAEKLQLSFSYGLSQPMLKENGLPLYSKPVEMDKPIGELPSFDSSPSVTIGDGLITEKYYPYSNGGWYKTSTKTATSERLTKDTLYWTNQDTQIYLVYDVASYLVSYHFGDSTLSAYVEYNTAIPSLIQKDGYTNIIGWYLDKDLKTPAPTLMPPYPINLYAKIGGK